MAINIQNQASYNTPIPIPIVTSRITTAEKSRKTTPPDISIRAKKSKNQQVLLRNSITISSIKSTLHNKRTNYRNAKHSHVQKVRTTSHHPLNSDFQHFYEEYEDYEDLEDAEDDHSLEGDAEEDDDMDYSYCDDFSISSGSSSSTNCTTNDEYTRSSSSASSVSSQKHSYSYYSYNNDCSSFSYVSRNSRFGSIINIPKTLGSSFTSNNSSSADSSFDSIALPCISISNNITFSPPSIVASPATSSLVETMQSVTKSDNSKPLLLQRSTSTESLYNLLRNHDDSSDKRSESSISKLTTSFRSWKDSLQRNLSTYSLLSESPRMTDDVLPPIAPSKSHSRRHTLKHFQTPATLDDVWEEEEPEDEEDSDRHQELCTFDSGSSEIVDEDGFKTPSCKSFKNRDHRINSSFLRLYAFDYNARMNSKTLPNTTNVTGNANHPELYKLISEKPQLLDFHNRYNVSRISNLSRDKLWNSVILPPRSDDSPSLSIDCNDYIYLGESDEDIHYSLIRKSGNYLPWDSASASLRPTLRPAGILNHGKTKVNGMAPNSGFTKSQFTVKGWCNPRWVDSSV
ncbi:uncharacterized protein RJT20DRAFT_124477 [Scheffersomyces xylosifermentans]|uniref:uncharacterized protein n=1 Tax=Scheffersomyces xylosifermentans TaxID=1304137 RepID=UPI00315D4C05